MRYPLLFLAGLFVTVYSFSQNIGIGTSTPQYKLTVQTPSQSYGMVHTNGNIRIGTYTGSSILAGEGAWLGTLSNHPLYLFTVGSDPQVTVTQNGYVGINTMAPFGALDVRRIPGNLGTAFFQGTTYGSVFYYSTPEDIYIRGGKAGSNIIINDVAPLGNVGIGTDVPADKLTVRTASDRYGLTHTDGAITVGSYVGAGAGWFGTKSNHPLYFFTNNGGSLMQILTNGRVTIGGSTAIYRPSIFTVHGAMTLSNPAFENEWEIMSGGFTSGVSLYFTRNGNIKAIVDDNGDWNSLSDKGLKENIMPYKTVLEGIKKLQISTYHYKSNAPSSKSFGLIAQDVNEYFPEIVSEIPDKDGKKLLGIAYGKTGVLALKAIQEQQVIIESQQQKIDELENRLLMLEKIIRKN